MTAKIYQHTWAKVLQPHFSSYRGRAQMSNVVIVLLFHTSNLEVCCSNVWIVTPFLKLQSTWSPRISVEETKSYSSFGCSLEALRRTEN